MLATSSKWFAAAACLLAGCGLPAPVTGELDDGLRPHHARLVSVEVPRPTAAQLAAPVVIAAHGFNATEFETSLAAERLRIRAAGRVQRLLATGAEVQ